MTLSQLRRRINALKRQFAHELAIIKLRRIAETVSNDWTPSEPPEPPTSSSASSKPVSGSRLSLASAATWTTPDEKASSPSPTPSSSVCSPGPGTTATIYCCAGTFRPRNHGQLPEWIRVRPRGKLPTRLGLGYNPATQINQFQI